ncbi:Downstream target of A 2 [Hibiscus syriacus]|uniref:Downstream target of A 2 n=1 Tax=Hibiscus syriacus TaxID=106335 RepID=A0A6A2ZSB7_HIBSY|nr:uncharacterized protein LOC120141120 [Hibiscus syriacus]KAE8693805.1 Downstream target of A 2 [Hibiscus syriacus]
MLTISIVIGLTALRDFSRPLFVSQPIIRGTPFGQAIFISVSYGVHRERIEYPLNCSDVVGFARTCSDNYQSVFESEELNTEACPDYFRWIHEDLKQWNTSGITKDMIERGIPSANDRLVIINGSAYVEKYKPSFQTRDVVTIWGILQLLRLYPGKVPDLDLLFYTGDNTVIMKRDYNGPNAIPPPLFHYCREAAALDIEFPDWTFCSINIVFRREKLEWIRVQS